MNPIELKHKFVTDLSAIMPEGEALSELNFVLKEHFNISLKDLVINPNIISEYKSELEAIVKERVKTRKPLQYILHKASFMGEIFYVDENVLIPRPETEILVTETAKLANSNTKILEIGTGSGCIAISLAQLLKNNHITTCDISLRALTVAKKNAQMLCSEYKINFVHSDLFENIAEKFDIIISNPPYIAENLKSGMQPEVTEFEPHGALFATDEGLYFYKKIIQLAPQYLNKNGVLAFEVGINQSRKIKELLENQGFSKIIIIPDLSAIDRVVLGYYN